MLTSTLALTSLKETSRLGLLILILREQIKPRPLSHRVRRAMERWINFTVQQFVVLRTLIEQHRPTEAVPAPHQQRVSSRQTAGVPVIGLAFFVHRTNQPPATVVMIFQRAVLVPRNRRLRPHVHGWNRFRAQQQAERRVGVRTGDSGERYRCRDSPANRVTG